MITAEYQEKYLRAIEAKELLYSSCRKLADGHEQKEADGVRKVANSFFDLFIAGTASERKSGLDSGPTHVSAARQMADLFIERLTSHHHFKELNKLSHETARCIMDTVLLRIVHPEVEAYSYYVGGAVRFEGLSDSPPKAIAIAGSLITDAIIEPASIELNSSIYTIKIKFESASFLLDELFSALLLGKVKSIVRRKRGVNEEFANMIESILVERKK